MTQVYSCSEYQQLDIYINDICSSLSYYSWTYCELDELRARINPTISIPNYANDLKNILSTWEYEIINTNIINNNSPIRVYNHDFDDYSFYTNVYLYILYYLIDKDCSALRNMIYDIYDTYDINGLQSLCCYFYTSYLSIDNVQYIDNCHVGFRNIYKMIRIKSNTTKIDNYEIISILNDYLNIPEPTEIIINTLYKRYIKEIFKILEEQNSNQITSYKLQHSRLIKLLKMYNSPSKIIKQEHGIVKQWWDFIINCASLKCIPKDNPILMFVSTFFFRKRIIKYKLLQKSFTEIENYFNKLNYIYKNQSIEHVLNYEKEFINLQS